jgi:hypothetical protein
MSWNLEGEQVEGLYLDGIRVTGRVELSRVKYGGEVTHHVALDRGLTFYGITRAAGERVIIEHKNITRVFTN